MMSSSHVRQRHHHRFLCLVTALMLLWDDVIPRHPQQQQPSSLVWCAQAFTIMASTSSGSASSRPAAAAIPRRRHLVAQHTLPPHATSSRQTTSSSSSFLAGASSMNVTPTKPTTSKNNNNNKGRSGSHHAHTATTSSPTHQPPLSKNNETTTTTTTNTDTADSIVGDAGDETQSNVTDSSDNNNNTTSEFSLSSYNFWEESLTIQSFYMDLQNLCEEDPHRAWHALDIMNDLYEGKQHPGAVQPDTRCYNTVIEAFVQTGDPYTAQTILDAMEERADRQQQQQQAALSQSSTSTPTPVPAAPSEYTYLLVVQAWADDIKDDVLGASASQAERVVRRMMARGHFQPTVKLWSVVMEGWCRRAAIAKCAMPRAEQLLSEMEESYQPLPEQEPTHNPKIGGADTSSSTCLPSHTATPTAYRRHTTTPVSPPKGKLPPPNIITYTSYIGGLARSRDRTLARKADATLVRMERFGAKPDVVAYTSVLHCWAKATNRREREMAASRALRILDEMERKYNNGSSNRSEGQQEEEDGNDYKSSNLGRPSLITYATAIRAIGNSLDPNAAQLAEDVLRRLYRLGADWNLKPTTSTYNAVINAWSRASPPSGGGRSNHQKNQSHKARFARKSERLLWDMFRRTSEGEREVEPDVRTWAAVLRAWSTSGASDAAEQCQRVLGDLERLYREGTSSVGPNYVCYTTVMGAWGNSRRPDAMERLEEILKQMEDGYADTLEPDIRPNTVSYVTAIDAFVRRNERNAARRAQKTVDRMLQLYARGLGHVRPTRIVFNTLINAWSKSRDRGAAHKAEKIFTWMEAQYKAGDYLVRPDEVSLCAVLNAWANHAEHGGAQRAIQIFKHMQSLTLEQRGFHISITMPNIVVKAIARSGHVEAVRLAEDILLKLESDFIFGKSTLRPDVTTYSSVINCCAYYRHHDGQAEALTVALRTFQKLCDTEDEAPNNITFGTLFKAIAKLMPHGDQRDELTRKLFDQCCEEGLVDGFVLSQVRSANPQLYRDLAEDGGLGGPTEENTIANMLKYIPMEWSTNVLD